MVDSKLIKSAFSNYISLEDRLTKMLSEISELHRFKKGEKIYKKGTVCESISVVKSGIVRSYHLNEGEEMTVWFGETGDFITSFHSFLTGEDSIETIECIEDTTVITISIEDFKRLVAEEKEISLLYARVLEKSYLYWEQRYIISQMKDSEQRYEHFYNKSDGMVHRLPLKFLSSYLNVRPETLSRIRKRWLKRK